MILQNPSPDELTFDVIRRGVLTHVKIFAFAIFGLVQGLAEILAQNVFTSQGYATPDRVGGYGFLIFFVAAIAFVVFAFAKATRSATAQGWATIRRWLTRALAMMVPFGLVAGVLKAAFVTFVIPVIGGPNGASIRGFSAIAIALAFYVAAYLVAARWSEGLIDAR